MKRFAFLGLLVYAVFGAANPQLGHLQYVYLLRMGNGMDQYLANHLTEAGALLVVTDPAKADAIFTDHIGEAFEAQVKDLYAPPPEPKKESKDKDKDTTNDPGAMTAAPAAMTGFSRGKGSFFLVDRRTMQVVWSIYERPKDNSPDTLNRTARKIVARFQRDRAELQQPAK
jgi:hypothetical protein